MAILIVEDHPNPDMAPRIARASQPMKRSKHWGHLADLVAKARALHRDRPEGRHLICEIVTPGRTIHVSQNGRVWEGRTLEWTTETREIPFA